MTAELVVELDDPLELAPDRSDPLLQLARALLHRESTDAERYDLEIREERVRRSRDHLAFGTVRAQVGLPFLFAQHEVVVDGFRWDVHDRKVDRSIGGRDVPTDRVAMPPDPLQERTPLPAAGHVGDGIGAGGLGLL